MGGTQKLAGRLQGADEAGLRPSSPCPKGLLATKLLARHNANHCSLAELEEAGITRLGSLFSIWLGLQNWGKPWGERGGTLPGDSCVPQFPLPAGTVSPRGSAG